jgi:hypothetical protein
MAEKHSRVGAQCPATRKELRFSRLWTILGVLLVCFVIFLSLAPTQSLPDFSFSAGDKVGHLLAYAAMMFWFGQIFRKRRASLLLAAGFVALGIVLEYIQGSTGYRTFEYPDMAANGIGVVSGLFLSRSKLGELLSAFEGLLPGRPDRRSSRK